MAIEIIGNKDDVKRYRRMLEKQGILTKSALFGMIDTKNDPMYADKPDGFRLMFGKMKAFIPENSESKALGGYDPDEKLYIKGIANAAIEDRMSEKLNPAGCDLRNFQKNRVLLSDHMYWNQSVIGRVVEMRAEADGVHFEAYIGDPKKGPLTNTQKEIRGLVAQELLQTVSVGFIPKKIRAPVFDDEGRMIEPIIIEEWELLELSVVAIPCNPDATFEMRQYFKKNAVPIPTVIPSKESAKKSKVNREMVQSLSFDKDLFTLTLAKRWADENEFKNETVTETEEHYNLKQRSLDDFVEDSLRTMDLDDGVKAVIGKLSERENEMDEKTALELVDAIKGLSTSVGQLIDSSERGIKMSEEIIKRLETKGSDKPKENENENENEDDENNNDEKSNDKSSNKSEFVTREEFDNLKLTMEKVLEVVEHLAQD